MILTSFPYLIIYTDPSCGTSASFDDGGHRHSIFKFSLLISLCLGQWHWPISLIVHGRQVDRYNSIAKLSFIACHERILDCLANRYR